MIDTNLIMITGISNCIF